MKNSKRLIVVVVSLVFLYNKTVIALAPFGPPRAMIGADKWIIGADYSHQSIDMQSFGIYREGYVDDQWFCKYNQFDIKDLKSNLIFGKLGYGLGDTWDIFARAGVSNASGDLMVPSLDSDGLPATSFLRGGEEIALDHGFNLAWGAGSRMTFAETGDLAFGTIIQMTWVNPKESSCSWTDPLDSDVELDASVDLNYWEIQFAIGATLNLGNAWLYGGPFLYFSQGNLDMTGTWIDTGMSSGPIVTDHDLREDSNLGGFGGMQWNVSENVCFYAEGQFMGNGWGIGSGIAWRVN